MTLPNSFLTGTNLVCLVCPDLEAAVRRCCDDLGLGPWEFYDFIPPGQRDDIIGGKPVPYTMRVTFTQLGAVGWAFIEPLEGPTIYADFLERKGLGVHHAGFEHVGLNYDGALGEFVRRGFEVVQSGFFGGRYCYFPTREGAHIIFELVDEEISETIDLIKIFPEPGAEMPAGLERTVSLGLVSADLDATLRVYADRLGIGPWSIEQVGERGSGRVRRASAMLGDFLWEIVEPIEGASLYREFLDRRGEGVHHVGVMAGAQGYAAALKALDARGIGTLGVEAGAAYLAAEPVLGARLKLYGDEGVPGPGGSGEIYPAPLA